MELRQYQEEAVDHTWAFMRQTKGRPLIVLPTGAGKSLVIAQLAADARRRWGSPVIVLAHVKELLEQNADKLRKIMPDFSVGVYSAGLKQRDTTSDVVVAGIQSVHKKPELFSGRFLAIVDEAHLIPSNENTMYQRFLEGLYRANGNKLGLIGLTATPYRTDYGSIADGEIFDAVSYEVKVSHLIDQGYLAKITNKPVISAVDFDSIAIRNKEYVPRQMEDAYLAGTNVADHVRQMIALCEGRRSILVFTSGVQHAERLMDEIASHGERADVITGDTHSLIRASLIEQFRNGDLRWLVNVNVLTTGFDAPGIDAIAVIRATQSPGLFAQICGRGFRLAPGKEDCLILDFGGNLERHGELDSENYGKEKPSKGSGTTGDSETFDGATSPLMCGECHAHNHRSAMFCLQCGMVLKEFSLDLQSDVLVKPHWYTVDSAHCYTKPSRKDQTPMLVVSYHCHCEDIEGNLASTTMINEYVLLEHEGYLPKKKAYAWWMHHSAAPVPELAEEAYALWKAGHVIMPRRIRAKRVGKFFEILERELDELPEYIANDLEIEEKDPWEIEEELPF